MSRPERQSFAFMPSQQPKSSSPPRPAGSTPPWREQPEQPVTVPTSAMQATMLQSRFDNLDTSSAAASVGPAATVPHLLLGATDGATMLQPGQPLPKQKKKARRPLAQQPPVLRTALRAASGGADAMRELQASVPPPPLPPPCNWLLSGAAPMGRCARRCGATRGCRPTPASLALPSPPPHALGTPREGNPHPRAPLPQPPA